MAARSNTAKRKKAGAKARSGEASARPEKGRKLWRWVLRGLVALGALVVLVVALYAVLNPPTTYTMWSEERRLGRIEHEWVPIEEVAPVMARSVVAAEDARFCAHWGFDLAAIRAAIKAGAERGASTISQQVVKNVYLWQGRSWPRKALEAVLTPLVEAIWTKRRIVEVYLNVAEFGEGVFGVSAASRHYFDVAPGELSAAQAARLAAILPDPKDRSAARPSDAVARRAGQIRDGAVLIAADGRAACFE